MKEEPLIFIYGTLLHPSNEFGAYLRKHGTFCEEGKMKGYLYDAGDYPAAVYDPTADTYVHGSVYYMYKPDEVLKVLDEYEGFGEHESGPDEFIRKTISIQTARQIRKCHVYLYNREAEKLNRIHSGDYLTYKKSPEKSFRGS